MNESITRAAGGVNGQEFDAASLAQLIVTLGLRPRQRTTMYGTPASIRNALAESTAGVMNEYSVECGGSQWRGA
jgi:FO synthase